MKKMLFGTFLAMNAMAFPGLDEFQPGYWRGPQPTQIELEYLRTEVGIRSIIDLQTDESDAMEEWEYSYNMGIDYNHIPLGVVSPPKDHEMAYVHNLMEFLPKPVYVHCRRGKDRTGMVVAYHLVVSGKMTYEEAVEDMYDHGFNRLFYWWWVPALKRAVRLDNDQ